MPPACAVMHVQQSNAPERLRLAKASRFPIQVCGLTELQNGERYIEQATAHQPYDDPRAQGYTLVARTVFSSKADMDFYDNECEAHAAIKSYIKPKVGGPPLVVYMDA